MVFYVLVVDELPIFPENIAPLSPELVFVTFVERFDDFVLVRIPFGVAPPQLVMHNQV